jgi:signal transduction histidine kinase
VRDDGSLHLSAAAYHVAGLEDQFRAVMDWFRLEIEGAGGSIDGPSVVTDLAGTELNGRPLTAAQQHALRELGLSSALIVPLSTRGMELGALLFVMSESGRRFDDADMALAVELARRTSATIENANLYRQTQAAVKQREEFVSIASHELKTPLTTVKGYVQLLARELQSRDPDRVMADEFLRELLNQIGRFEGLVADLLDASRAQQGRLDLKTERFDLAVLAADVLDRFARAGERTDRHVLRFEGLQPVLGKWDRPRIDQVLTNLISNAIKYSPEGGEVVVSVNRREDTAEITVRDQGIGIGSSEMEHLFRPFARSAGARIVEGTGLGLYITSQIVERHGGTIAVESEPGAGSTFTVRLPLNSAADTTD